MSQSTTATIPPGLTQRNPCLAFGVAQYRIASIRLKMISSTGHLAMSQAVIAAEPTPSTCPTWRARPPVTTTISADAPSSTMSRRVTPKRSGIVFQTGRPSGTS